VRQASTILVVDDEALIRWSLSERLRVDGCTVIEAEDGRGALECVDDHVDLAVLDYRLPDTDGLTLLRRLRGRYPRLQAMLLTAYATPETALQAADAGFFGLVRKPFDLDDIASMIRGALETAGQARP
jgi:DNA-binding NtrC family response regulator